MNSFSFNIEKTIPGKLGRAGIYKTPHGSIHTPSFVAVGTKATVKALTPEELKEIGLEVVLANTYHLYLQPGDELIAQAGGIHKFMSWPGPIMTDSGGFQVFSLGAAYGKELSKVVSITDPSLLLPDRADDSALPKLATIGEEGVSFRSHIDGSLHYITPEKSIDIQHNIGADIIFAFDECTSPVESFEYQKEAMDRTHRWARESLKYHKEHPGIFSQALFGIVQGGRSEVLRKESAEILSTLNFDGYGIGGSFSKEDMNAAVLWVNSILPPEKPRHLLGIGEPEDLFSGVEHGVDLFDCVAPTRNARNGSLYTQAGKLNILNAGFMSDFNPIDSGCACYTCKNFTRAYLAHLFRAKEMLGATLATIHNLYFISTLVSSMRQAILEDTFFDFRDRFLASYIR